MYTARREAAENTEKREIVGRRTYGHMCQSAHGSKKFFCDGEALIQDFCRAAPRPLTRASPGSAGTLLSTVMILAIIVTTTRRILRGERNQ